MGDDKAPRLDGFTAKFLNFFKSSWSVVGTDVCIAVREFFVNGQMLKEINNTQGLDPRYDYSYRPISCCNIIYKCIS